MEIQKSLAAANESTAEERRMLEESGIETVLAVPGNAYRMIWVACANRLSGNVRPSAFAVL